MYRPDDEDAAAFAARRAGLIRDGALLAEACGARFLKLEYPGDVAGCEALTDASGPPGRCSRPGSTTRPSSASSATRWRAAPPGSSPGRSIWKESVGMDAEGRRAFLGGEARRRLDELLEMVS